MRASISRLVVAAVAGSGLPAWACPVCGQAASQQGQAAYVDMTAMMSLLPLAAMGGIAAYVVVKARAHARAEEQRER